MSVKLEQFAPAVRRFALALTRDPALAEDLSQETFLKAIKHHKTLQTASNPKNWLLTILTNLWRDQLRTRQRRPQQQFYAWQQIASKTDPTRSIEANEELEKVLSTFQELPTRQRQVLYLRAVELCSIDEICEILKVSRGSVKSNLSIARKSMRRRHAESTVDQYE